ncbi:MAG: hypothetical protein IPL59_16365 [Candidatus Competibacteraceae bacterium]|nr:hypothetical protein [Candidatus Competibacteraceae bacterium]
MPRLEQATTCRWVIPGGFTDSTAWRRQLEAVDEDYASDEDYETSTEEALTLASGALPRLSLEEKALLESLSRYADQSTQGPDCKAQTLIRWLNMHLRPNGDWNGERVILFTEYRATQKWLHDLLAHQGFAANGRLLMIYGGMPHDDRDCPSAHHEREGRGAGSGLGVLMRAALKVETICEDLGKVGPVIAAQVEEAMLGKRRGLDTTQAEREAEPVRRLLKFERQLRDQLKKLMDQLQDTQAELQLKPEHV